MGFGKRVIGEDKWKAQESAAKLARERGANLGSRVTGPVKIAPDKTAPQTEDEPSLKKPEKQEEPPQVEAVERPAEDAIPQLSVKELDKALKENDSLLLFDQLKEAEFDRPEGPRKGGLRQLIQAENQRDEPRDAVIAELTVALGV